MKDKFIEDNTGKSKAYYLKNRNKIFLDKQLLSYVLKLAVKEKKDFRICFHKNKKDKLHNMLNVIYKNKKKKFFHKHINKDEIYNIIFGELEIKFFNKSKKSVIILNKFQPICRIPKGTFHQVNSRSRFSLFHEIRLGPFYRNDSVLQK